MRNPIYEQMCTISFCESSDIPAELDISCFAPFIMMRALNLPVFSGGASNIKEGEHPLRSSQP